MTALATLLVTLGSALSAGNHIRQELEPPPPPPPLSSALASWYEDGGQTASGWHAFYGVANRYLRFGTRVLFAYRGRQVLATVDDRGPYVYDRTWDLNQNVAGALGFAGVDVVRYRIGG